MKPGDALAGEEVLVGAERMKTMSALMRDANPIHFDPDAVRALGLGDRPVNQGPLNQAYVVTMLARWSGGRVRALRLRYLGTVFAGDRVRAGGRVTAIGGGVAECEVWLDVVGGDRVLAGTAVVEVP